MPREIEGDEAERISALMDKMEPFETMTSTHLYEERYLIEGRTYRRFSILGEDETWIEVQ